MNDEQKTPKNISITVEPRPNYICNFRAPDVARFQVWKDYKKWAADHGLDVCNLTLSLVDSFLKGVKGVENNDPQIVTPHQVINLQQNNTFLYSVEKPRREPLVLNCAKKEYSRTITSAAWESYVTEKARDLNRSFCFRDFLEIGHESFRKIILRLRKKGKVIALPQRTNPRFYVLSEWFADYPTVHENTRIKPRFTR